MTKLTFDREAALARIPYLRMLPAAELRGLADTCEFRALGKGERAFGEGEPPSGLFLIMSGRVKIVRSSREGREQVLHEEGPGGTLGEVPVLDGAGYVGSAVALEDSMLLYVPRAPLLQAMQRNPECASTVIQVLAGRVRKFAVLAADLSLRGVTQRVAAYLIAERDRAGADSFILRYTREEVATQLGTVREQVSRALAALARARAIDVDGRRVQVIDPAALRTFGALEN